MRRSWTAPPCARSALEHSVCPYYLGSEMARWSDVVVGDYNYWFDGGAMLYNLAQANAWRVSVLADEAHNLVSRARSMYSRRPGTRQPARRARGGAAPVEKSAGQAGPRLDRRRPRPCLCRCWTSPGGSLAALTGAVSAITEHLAASAGTARPGPAGILFRRPAVRAPGRILRRTLAVRRHGREDERDTDFLCIRNVVPAPFLGRASPRRPFDHAVLGHAQSLELFRRPARHAPGYRPGSTSSRRSRPPAGRARGPRHLDALPAAFRGRSRRSPR
jgi:DNA excision repair protein ERCC-2